MWHDEVKNHLWSTCNPKKVKKQQIDQVLTKLAPTALDAYSHSPKLDITTIQAIAAVKCGDVTTAAASNEEIRLRLQTSGSNSTTPEEQALGIHQAETQIPLQSECMEKRQAQATQSISQTGHVW